MISAQNLREIDKLKDVTENTIERFMESAARAHTNYILIDRRTLPVEMIKTLRESGFNVLVGMGDEARIKISW